MSTPASITGPFVAEAAARGVRPPIRLVEHNVGGWALDTTTRDTIAVDEFGDLWWVRPLNRYDARVVRPLWPEEFSARSDLIARAVRSLLERL